MDSRIRQGVLGAALSALIAPSCGRSTLDTEDFAGGRGGRSGAAGAARAGAAGTRIPSAGGAAQAGAGGIAASGGRAGAATDDAGVPRKWQPPVAVGHEGTYGFLPAVALDDQGNALVAWRENSPGHQIWASRFSNVASAWSASEVVPFVSGFVNFTTAGFDETGAAQVAIWIDQTGPELGRYDVTLAAWQVLSIAAPQAGTWPGVPAISGTSGIVGLWQENPNLGGDPLALWTGRFDPLSGWTARQRFDLPASEGVEGAWIDASAQGHAAAVWRLWSGGTIQVWAATWEAASGAWTSPTRIDQTAAGPPREASIATDDAGNAMAIWVDDAAGTIVARRYDAGLKSWQELEVVGSGALPRVSLDESGFAIAVWVEAGAPRTIGWNRHVDGRWQPQSLSLEALPGDSYEPDVAVNSAGQAVVAWSTRAEPSVVPVIWVSRLE